ncbi:MAG: hypothetical protein QOJ11_2967 [Frankiales bacterium]|jgi:hypothetical protein|nr:hypothetical protein [Frankiales bacterium]
MQAERAYGIQSLLAVTITAAVERKIPAHAKAARFGTALVGAMAAYHPLRLAIRAVAVQRTAPLRELARQALVGAFLTVADSQSDVDPSGLGLHAFVAQRKVLPPFQVYLGPVARFRLGARPPATKMMWTPGLGVVGQSFALRQVVAVDNGELARSAADPSSWRGLPTEQHMGLTPAQALRLARYYGAVIAVPIITREGRPRGCVVMDTPPGTTLSTDTSKQVVAALSEAAQLLADGLQELSRWLYRG